MTIFILKRLYNLESMPYGVLDSVIVEAESEDVARNLAKEKEDCEEYKDFWLNTEETSCDMIQLQHENRIIHTFSTFDA